MLRIFLRSKCRENVLNYLHEMKIKISLKLINKMRKYFVFFFAVTETTRTLVVRSPKREKKGSERYCYNDLLCVPCSIQAIAISCK